MGAPYSGGNTVVRLGRSILAAAFFVGFGVGGLALGLLLSLTLLFGSKSPRRGSPFCRRCVRAAYRLFTRAAHATGLFRIEISPEDRAALAATHGCVVAASHPSLIDVVVLMSLLPDSTALAKSAAGRNFFYSRVVAAAFIMNDDPMRAISDSSALLAQGVNIVVFPEGTRTPAKAKEHRLRRGAAQIALHSGAPVVCVSIESDPPVLAKGQPWWDVGGRIVRYGIAVRGSISPNVRHAAASTHSDAVLMTNAISRILWSSSR